VDKPINPNATMFPACWTCPERIVQSDWVDPKNFDHISGCKMMGRKKWDKGVAKDASGTVYQRNCPLKTNLGKHP